MPVASSIVRRVSRKKRVRLAVLQTKATRRPRKGSNRKSTRLSIPNLTIGTGEEGDKGCLCIVVETAPEPTVEAVKMITISNL